MEEWKITEDKEEEGNISEYSFTLCAMYLDPLIYTYGLPTLIGTHALYMCTFM